jgi:hypothetical protein
MAAVAAIHAARNGLLLSISALIGVGREISSGRDVRTSGIRLSSGCHRGQSRQQAFPERSRSVSDGLTTTQPASQSGPVQR